MNYKYLFLEIISFVIGILYLLNLKKNENTDNLDLSDKFRKFRGFTASLGLVIIGVIIIYQKLVKMF